jgi:site-specific recombinase XerD
MQGIMNEIVLTPEQALAQGYISLAEAAKKPGTPDRTNLWRQVKAGSKPGALVSRGSKADYWILESSLGSGVSASNSRDYNQLLEKWLKGMEIGLYSHRNKPLSKEYVDGSLRWGLKKYWQILEEEPSIVGIDAENFAEVMASEHLRIDRSRRRDFYSTKMHIYRATTRFTSFLIKQGLKTSVDLDELRTHLPGQEYDPKRGFMDEAQVLDAIAYNRSWYDGRTQYDVEVTDMLLHLYFYAGLRRTEPAWLRVDGLDFANDLMLVFGKGSKERYVPMILFPPLKPKLQEWVENIRPKSNSELLLVQKDGSPLTKQSIKDRLLNLGTAMRVTKAKAMLGPQHPEWTKKQLRDAAVELAKGMKNPVLAHDYRRGCATILAGLGMPVHMLQEVLGHADLETTRDYIQGTTKQLMTWTRSNLGQGVIEDTKPLSLNRREALKHAMGAKN